MLALLVAPMPYSFRSREGMPARAAIITLAAISASCRGHSDVVARDQPAATPSPWQRSCRESRPPAASCRDDNMTARPAFVSAAPKCMLHCDCSFSLGTSVAVSIAMSIYRRLLIVADLLFVSGLVWAALTAIRLYVGREAAWIVALTILVLVLVVFFTPRGQV